MALGRAADPPEGAGLLGSVVGDPHDFVLLNDAFAVDPLVVDVAAGASVEDPVVVVHVVGGRRRQGRVPPDGDPGRCRRRRRGGRDRGRRRHGLLADAPTDLRPGSARRPSTWSSR